MLASLIAGVASGETLMAVRRARRAAIAYMLAGAMMLGCGGFLLAAGYIWAAQRFGPIEAALGFAGGFFLIAAAVLIVHKLTSETRTRRASRKRKADLTALGVTAGLSLLPTLLRGKGGLGLVVGPAIALVAYTIYRENTKPGAVEPDDVD